uniref:NADH-ubiquinone oxidoreductase chain 4 n=1 Tax=Eurysternus hamaticollis TaxID=206867 RepID=A0A1X9HF57_9SCAR|nr:NADH deshydrogenase subunit 4 [Eurysternus hamaticollis]
MKFCFMMLFMIPLSFKVKSFWLNQLFYFILFFLFLISFSYNFLFKNVSYFLGCDLLSYMMVLLSIWICGLMMMASEGLFYKNYFYNLFIFFLLILLIALFFTFTSMNLFMFYLFFEISLIPTLFLIVGWGYQPERLQAGIYLLFYTLFASLPMMISIFYYYEVFFNLDIFFMYNLVNNWYMYMCLNMVFFIKIPMFLVHLWLPKAHVEAPISGSMILAGVLLKLGGYGLMRFMSVFLNIGMKINLIFIILSLFGGVLVSLICLRQVDIKSLIAYSSVVHMGLVLSGIMTLTSWGMVGALIMMIAHGLCSSGLFCLANLNYERLNSRSLYLNKGMINYIPSMSLWWFLLSSSNMAAPPSLNLLGEIFLINSLVGWSWLSMLMLMFLSFFSAVYSLYLYAYTQHGKININFSFNMGYLREYLLLLLHWLPLNIMILKSEYFFIYI